MPTHKKDLKRHPALTSGSNQELHKAIIVADPDHPGRASLFLDGREIVLAPDGVGAYWDADDVPRVAVDILAETIEVISWDEMEKRAY